MEIYPKIVYTNYCSYKSIIKNCNSFRCTRRKFMNNQNYSLYNKIADFQDYTEKYIVNNIPSVHRNIRIKLLDEIYMLPKNMFYASYNKGNIRMKYLTELQVTISLIDMLLYRLRKIEKIKKHNLDVAISKLGNVKNIVYGWKFKEEKN